MKCLDCENEQYNHGPEWCTQPYFCCVCCVRNNLERPNCINRELTIHVNDKIIDVTTGEIKDKNGTEDLDTDREDYELK